MSREANQLVNAGRQAFTPTVADRARLMAALAGSATLSIGAAASVGVTQRSMGLVFKVVQSARRLALALPLAAAGAYGWHAARQPPVSVQTARPVSHPPAAAAPKTAAPPVQVTEAPPAEPVSEPSARISPERSASPVAEPFKPGNEVRQEVALLSRAQAALSRGRPQEALEALSEHALRFPRGVLAEERGATRVRTLCALGRRQEAETELKHMERLNPTSAYLARAREACESR